MPKWWITVYFKPIDGGRVSNHQFLVYAADVWGATLRASEMFKNRFGVGKHTITDLSFERPT